MAFGSAAGYGNLPSGNFAPEIFSQKVLKFFRRASVVEDITNTDYAGEIDQSENDHGHTLVLSPPAQASRGFSIIMSCHLP